MPLARRSSSNPREAKTRAERFPASRLPEHLIALFSPSPSAGLDFIPLRANNLYGNNLKSM